MTDAVTASVGNDLFLRNMRALWRRDPQLALLVDAVQDADRLPLTLTKSGHWTTTMATPQAKATYLHSRYDPIAEGNRFIDSVSTEDAYCFVVSGLGLGYHIHALLDRLVGDAFVLCAEPSIPLIATALTCVDLHDALESDRLVLLTDNDKTRLHERLKDRGAIIMLGARFVQHPPSMRIAGPAHRAITEAIGDFVSFTRMTLMTLVANSRITCRNIAMNLVNYVATPPIDILKGRFAGDPAIIISAGPSLARNIDQLKALKGRAVLCAVQTAVKPLLERGVEPDFVTSLDFHEMSRKFFEDIGDLSGVHLVAEPKATWHVIDNYPGPVSLLDNQWARLVIGDELAGRDGLQAGATVAHLAFYLAVYMGCDPIIFVGQDLAFTGHVFYVPGVEIHRAWRGELNRFNSMEHKEWDRIVRNRPILRRIPGALGGELYTDELLLTYLEQFVQDFAAAPCRVVNATEGGAHLRGSEVMTLADATARFCARPLDEDRFAYRKSTNWCDPSRRGKTKAQLDSRIEELDGVVGVCDELLALFEELRALTGDPDKFNRRLVRVDELRTKIHNERLAYQIVNAHSQLAELQRFSADRRLNTKDTDGVERAKLQLDRDVAFITSVRDGAVDVAGLLRDARDRITAAMESA